MHRAALTSVLAVLLTGGAVLPATAAAPTVERIEISESIYDDFVSEVCGFDVWLEIDGFAIVRVFDRASTGPLQVFTVNLTLTLSSGDQTYTLKDVGADTVMMRPDGSVDVSIMGQVPFGHKGLYRFDAETGEPLKGPSRETFDEIFTVCEALAG
jgi:hypothetical protein